MLFILFQLKHKATKYKGNDTAQILKNDKKYMIELSYDEVIIK